MFAVVQLLSVLACSAFVRAETNGELPTIALECGGECLAHLDKVTDGNLRPCCNSDDVLTVKDDGKFAFGQCRTKSAKAGANSLAVDCNGNPGGIPDAESPPSDEESADESADEAEESVEEESGDDEPAVVDGGSGEGHCAASGLPSCARSTKCCASSRMPKTNCCEAGSKCIAKNKFYAACLPPFREERAKADPQWLAVELPCGKDVATV